MAYHLEPNGDSQDIVWDSFELGIASSPHKGIGNLQGVDINTQEGEVMCSYSRVQQTTTMTSGGLLTRINTNQLQASGGTPASLPTAGSWIAVSGSTISGLSSGNYFVFAAVAGLITLSTQYDPDGSFLVTGMGVGTANYSTVFGMGAGVAGAYEAYQDNTGAQQYRYYVLDANGRLWVYDTYQATNELWGWFLPYTIAIAGYNSGASVAAGMAVYCGYVFIFGGYRIFTVATCQLGTAPQSFSAGTMLSANSTSNPHYALATRSNYLFYTDGQYVGGIFADISIDPSYTGVHPNIQSYCSYGASTTTGTVSGVLNGSVPTEATTGTPTRLPAFFMAGLNGTIPSNLTAGTKYYIQYTNADYGKFQVYAAVSGGSPIDLSGSTGIQYFNTFFPQSSDGNTVLLFEPQQLTLPWFEKATCIGELGPTLIIGCTGNALYSWDQLAPFPGDALPLTENNVSWMITVNNVIYLGAGFRGNVYITNGSSVSLAIKVPDSCSGLIEPYFTWGGAMYLRGRVYFSIEDQTSSHTGNCGGIWSFIPTNNFYLGQDVGLALRMDNQNSYGTYNGVAKVLIPLLNQSARGPQFWSAWTSDISTPTYGIDGSGTVPSIAAIVQTDIVPTGTILNKATFNQVEFKLAAPLATSESVAFAYRTNLSDAFTAFTGTVNVDSDNLSGYLPIQFNRSQWVQLQATLTPNGQSTSSFVRLSQLRLR